MRWKLPIYEYECSDCHYRFERKQRFDDEPVSSCPKCKGKSRRVIHSVPIVFKGSGFYCTDHGRGSSGNGHRKDMDSEVIAESKSESPAGSNMTPTSKVETTADSTS